MSFKHNNPTPSDEGMGLLIKNYNRQTICRLFDRFGHLLCRIAAKRFRQTQQSILKIFCLVALRKQVQPGDIRPVIVRTCGDNNYLSILTLYVSVKRG